MSAACHLCRPAWAAPGPTSLGRAWADQHRPMLLCLAICRSTEINRSLHSQVDGTLHRCHMADAGGGLESSVWCIFMMRNVAGGRGGGELRHVNLDRPALFRYLRVGHEFSGLYVEAEEKPPEHMRVPLEICGKPAAFDPSRGPVATALIERLGLRRRRLLRSQEEKGRAWLQGSYLRVRPPTALCLTITETCPSTEPLLASRLRWRQQVGFRLLSWQRSHLEAASVLGPFTGYLYLRDPPG